MLAETEESRAKFADNVLKFLVFYGFDGVRTRCHDTYSSILMPLVCVCGDDLD